MNEVWTKLDGVHVNPNLISFTKHLILDYKGTKEGGAKNQQTEKGILSA